MRKVENHRKIDSNSDIKIIWEWGVSLLMKM